MLRKSLISISLLFLISLSVILYAETADHSKFRELNRKFTKPEDVIRTCLSCHNLAGKDIMKTSHWLWTRKTTRLKGKEGKSVDVGKKNIINNFCVAVTSNEPRCTSCHIGYGWKDQNFNFKDETKIDCLVCHESTGTYQKFPAGSGYPVSKRTMFKGNKKWYDPPEYAKVAQSVKRPGRKNCGTCHFYGGGGNAVKHGALDKSLLKPDKTIDIHMAQKGANMSCVDCHEAVRHDIKGQLYSVSVENRDRLSCARCHTQKPHTQKLFLQKYETEDKMGHDLFKKKLYAREKPKDNFIHRILDKHYGRIACQSCHINKYSTKYKTKVWWDWSKAGKMNSKGKPLMIKDKDGDKTYDGRKGEFRLGKNLIPEYKWFNGHVDHILLGDKVEIKGGPIQINRVGGVCGKGDSKIWPFKIMRGKQPYDPVEKTLLVPKLFGKKGSGAYWADWDWNKSVKAGMKEANLKYSGKFEWKETEMNWPLTHLITGKENALKCIDCHSRNSRLKNIQACWIPGRDRSLAMDIIGMLMVIGSISGVLLHGIIRFKNSGKGE